MKKIIPKQTSLKSEIKAICDIMRRSNSGRGLQYVPELTWLLFLWVASVTFLFEATRV